MLLAELRALLGEDLLLDVLVVGVLCGWQGMLGGELWYWVWVVSVVAGEWCGVLCGWPWLSDEGALA